jgi:hypothetical protein
MGKNLKTIKGLDELLKKAKEEKNVIFTYKETGDIFRIKYIEPKKK